MRFDDRLNETQSKTKPAFCPADVATEQSIPDVRQFVRRNAGAGVAHAKQPSVPLREDFNRDVAARWRVFDSVVDQIGGDLFEAHPISGHYDLA
jgi:hypothetical protein